MVGDSQAGFHSFRMTRGICLMALSLAVMWSGAPLVAAGVCPADMIQVDGFCIDLYEAPNQAEGQPLVMYTFDEAEAWCQQRGRRLCFDDEWTSACAGATGFPYPYGVTHIPGLCNDDKTWLGYNQSLLAGWPAEVSSVYVTNLEELLDAARSVSPSGQAAADHVEFLYQGDGAGSSPGCVSTDDVLDLCGNVEEWTRRRDGGTTFFNGSLKGGYWAEPRTCQQAVTSHSNPYRFYQLGFRCCSEPLDVEIFSDDFETGNTTAWSNRVP